MEELNPSILGTQKHWDSVYDQELSDFHKYEHRGEEWFGRTATKRVVKWVAASEIISHNSKILDIGCGNGLMLLELAKLGFKNLTGVDYCKDALDLGKAIFKSEDFINKEATWLKLDVTQQTIICNTQNKGTMQSWNKYEDFPDGFMLQTFDLCLDKGTYDAISLSPDNACEMRSCYLECIENFLSSGPGLFIIVSCNWTAQELQSHFTKFRLLEDLPAPTFSFGGKSGKTVSTCVFQYQPKNRS